MDTIAKQRTAVATAGLALANVGIAIPWNEVTLPMLLPDLGGANALEWVLNIAFILCALALAVGWLTSQRVLRGAALTSAGLWTATGWYLWLASSGNMRDISTGIVCWGIALLAFALDYTSARAPREAE